MKIKNHILWTQKDTLYSRETALFPNQKLTLYRAHHTSYYIFTLPTLTLVKVIGSLIHKMLQTECLGDSRWLLNSPVWKVIKPGASAEAGFQSSPLSEPSRRLGFGPSQCSQQFERNVLIRVNELCLLCAHCWQEASNRKQHDKRRQGSKIH